LALNRTFSNTGPSTGAKQVPATIRPSSLPKPSTEDVQAGLTITEANQTLTSAATVSVTANATITEAAQTLTSAVAVAVKASLTATEATQTVTGAGGVLVTANLSVTEAAQTLTADGTVATPGITANLNITEEDQTLTADGTVTGDVAVWTQRKGAGYARRTQENDRLRRDHRRRVAMALLMAAA